MSSEEQARPGLRERKKAKTRAAIQQNALRLFRQKGYSDTTVEEIAEAAEISPSTFFRYFPSKESVVLEDDYDPLLIESFKKQPADLQPIQALRAAVKEGLSTLSQEERQGVQERMTIIMSIPELRAASLNQITSNIHMIATLAAERTGRESTDIKVLAFAGAVIGAIISIQFYWVQNPEADILSTIDEALESVEKGFSL